MKKKMLDCDVHGLTLHRCKRVDRRDTKKKHYGVYTEKCFKCIQEDYFNKDASVKQRRQKHLSFK